MSAYTFKAHGVRFRHLMRHAYFRVLLGAYAFFVFFGVMPKAPPRAPYQGQFDYMIDTVSISLAGFAALAIIVAATLAIWSAICALKGSKPPEASVPDEPSDGGTL